MGDDMLADDGWRDSLCERCGAGPRLKRSQPCPCPDCPHGLYRDPDDMRDEKRDLGVSGAGNIGGRRNNQMGSYSGDHDFEPEVAEHLREMREHIGKWWGDRCSEQQPGCKICQMWAFYDAYLLQYDPR